LHEISIEICSKLSYPNPEVSELDNKTMKKESIGFFIEFHHPDCNYNKKYTNTCTCGLNDNLIYFCNKFGGHE